MCVFKYDANIYKDEMLHTSKSLNGLICRYMGKAVHRYIGQLIDYITLE